MKTVLINPPQKTKYPQPSLGLASIAAVLEGENYQVKILDANALQLSESEVAKEIKKGKPSSTVIVGGAHVTVLPEETLRNVPEIDIIVRGEGEETVVELYDALKSGDQLAKCPWNYIPKQWDGQKHADETSHS
ncbi:MAG: cobalamin B12-binding domain-containing protein [Dehalococcoidales bacterium]|nr:cobalamin B12-binding domain-containing protein [Dehalococcoidales bacterium]